MRAVYITHNGIGTALVRSQVLPYLRQIAERGVGADLITFERRDRPAAPDGFPDERWHPLRAMPGAGLASKAVDVARGVLLAWRLLARDDAFAHARSYVPATIAWLACALLRRRYIFDMRGFLPEEYVEGGYWTRTDLRYRVLKVAEGRLLRDASAIVVLTHRAAERLRAERTYARAVGAKPVAVIPCAVDLERFHPGPRVDPPTLVYAGSLGLWYELDAMLAVFATARRSVPELRFLILNQGQQDLARRAAAAAGLSAHVDVAGVPFEDVPDRLGHARVGICLLRPTSSKLGSSPIKVAEYLACGLPVIVNAGQGDLDGLVARHGAGHVMRNTSAPEIARAAAALVALLDDDASREAARALAQREYSLDAAADGYLRLYREVAGSTS